MITVIKIIEKEESLMSKMIKQLKVNMGKVKASQEVALALKDKGIAQLQ